MFIVTYTACNYWTTIVLASRLSVCSWGQTEVLNGISLILKLLGNIKVKMLELNTSWSVLAVDSYSLFHFTTTSVEPQMRITTINVPSMVINALKADKTEEKKPKGIKNIDIYTEL